MKKYRLLAGVCCAVLSLSLLSGCSLLEKPEVQEITNKVVDTVKNSEELTALSQIVYDKLTEKLNGAKNFEVKELEKTDDYVKLEITAPNLEKILDDVYNEYKDELSQIKNEEDVVVFLEKKINEVIESEEFEIIKNQIKVEQFIDENGNLKIVETEDYLNAISGGLTDIYEAYQEKLAETESKN